MSYGNRDISCSVMFVLSNTFPFIYMRAHLRVQCLREEVEGKLKETAVIPYAQVFQISATHSKAHFPLGLVSCFITL